MHPIKTPKKLIEVALPVGADVILTQVPEFTDPPEYPANDVFARDFRGRTQVTQNQ